MAANPAKFQIMFLGMYEVSEISVDTSGVASNSSPAVKLLGVFLDRKINFETHIQSLCKKASQKLKALFRIRPYLNFRCAKRLCEAYYYQHLITVHSYGCSVAKQTIAI